MTRTIDTEGYERRTKRAGSIRCKCGKRVTLESDTEEWREVKDWRYRPMKWRHTEYGPPHGFCDCGFAYCGMPDGRMVRLDLREPKS